MRYCECGQPCAEGRYYCSDTCARSAYDLLRHPLGPMPKRAKPVAKKHKKK